LAAAIRSRVSWPLGSGKVFVRNTPSASTTTPDWVKPFELLLELELELPEVVEDEVPDPDVCVNARDGKNDTAAITAKSRPARR